MGSVIAGEVEPPTPAAAALAPPLEALRCAVRAVPAVPEAPLSAAAALVSVLGYGLEVEAVSPQPTAANTATRILV